MAFYDQKVVQEVREARRKGLSIKKLETRFRIPETTISRWIRDIPSLHKKFNSARAKEKQLKTELHSLAEDCLLDENLAKLFVSLLYWCEGSKYPSSAFFAFCNSDFVLVKTLLELLRYGFKIEEKKIRIHLQLHSTHPKDQTLRFWSDLLKIPLKQFYKPTITKPTRKMKRLNYQGTCTVKYFDVKLVLKIMGLYERFSRRFTSDGEVAERLKAQVC